MFNIDQNADKTTLSHAFLIVPCLLWNLEREVCDIVKSNRLQSCSFVLMDISEKSNLLERDLYDLVRLKT